VCRNGENYIYRRFPLRLCFSTTGRELTLTLALNPFPHID